MSDGGSDRRVVFVTGGSRGIGRSIVERFRAAGDRVAACARSRDGLREAAPDLALACDVARPEQVAASIEQVMHTWGRLDVLVNNAGVAGSNSLDADADDALWHRILDVNLHGTYHACKHALAHLPDGTGRIVNIASVLALSGAADQTAYTAAKHGVLGFTRALAELLAPRRITVNAICPGWVRTDMARERWRELGIEESEAGKIVEPAEVAELCHYLASPHAASISGQALRVG